MPTPSRALTPCPPDVAFRFGNGAAAHDLRDLRNVVEKSDAHTVESHRGHYHFWVRDVLAEPKLADELVALSERNDVSGEPFRERLLAVIDARVTALEKPPRARKASTNGGGKKSAAKSTKKKAAKKK